MDKVSLKLTFLVLLIGCSVARELSGGDEEFEKGAIGIVSELGEGKNDVVNGELCGVGRCKIVLRCPPGFCGANVCHGKHCHCECVHHH